MRIRILSILLLLCLFGVAKAEDAALRKQFEQELQSKSGDVTSIKCRFVQRREVAVLANAVTKSGNFYYRHPNNMLLAFSDGDHIKMTESWFEIKTGESTNKTKVSSNPMFRSLSSILSACVAGNFESVMKGFAVEVKPTSSEWIVEMTPQQGRAASKMSRMVIHLDRANMSLNSLKMEERSGDYTLYTFSEKSFNTTIDSRIFNIVE